MAETTADVRRDIEMTRERMSDTLAQLEERMNVAQVVRDHPWPAIALAVGAGMLLSGTGSDVRAAAATRTATARTRNKVSPAIDDLVARLMAGVTVAINDRVDQWVGEIREMLGTPAGYRGPGSGVGGDTGRETSREYGATTGARATESGYGASGGYASTEAYGGMGTGAGDGGMRAGGGAAPHNTRSGQALGSEWSPGGIGDRPRAD